MDLLKFYITKHRLICFPLYVCMFFLSLENISCQSTAHSDETFMKAEALDSLFQSLKESNSSADARIFENEIWAIWMNNDSKKINDLMEKGLKEMDKGDYTNAIEVFTKMIENDPNFAEGWNKRATVYYLRGNFKDSMNDISETLKREPRHFGALSGLASIQDLIGDDWGKLDTLKKLANIMPYDEDLMKQIKELEHKLGIERI